MERIILSQTQYTYFLEVTNPNNLIQEIEVSTDTSFGSSKECDLAAPGVGLAPIQGKFRIQNDILTYIQMNEDEILRIGKQVCKKGRMYILDQGDQITTQQKTSKKDKLKITIRKREKDQNEYEDEDKYEDKYEDEAQEVETDINELIENGPNVTDKETENFLDTNILDAQDNEKNNVQNIQVQEEEEEEEEVEESATEIINATQNRTIQPKTTSKLIFAPKRKGKGRKKYHEHVSGLLPRFLGMFYNIFIFILFYFQILPEIERASGIQFSILSKDLFTIVTPYLDKIPNKIAEIPYSEIVLSQLKEYLSSFEHFNILTLFISYEVIIHLILGVGLGQFFLGLRPKGNFLMVRLLAPIRLLFYFLTFPLFIFDLPIIMNRKSFKEVITFTAIISKSKKMLIFNSLVTLPLFILLFCNYELALDQASGSPILSKEVLDVPVAKAKSKKGEALFQIDLPSFHLHSKSPLNLKEIVIPTVEMRDSKYVAKLIIYKPKQKASLRIYQSNSVLQEKELISILRQDPLNLGNFDNVTGDDVTLPIETSRKVIDSIYQVITFNYADPLALLETLGPVTNPYQKIYNTIRFNIPIIYADRSMLLRGPFETLFTLELNGPNHQLSLIKLTSKGFITTRFEFAPKLRAHVIKFITQTWAAGKDISAQNKEGIQLITKLKNQERPYILLGAFSSINSLEALIHSKMLSQREIGNITNTFLQLSYHSLKTEDQMLQNIILDEMETLDKWLLLQDKKNKKQSLSEFRLGLLRIQKALEGKEEQFFKLNKIK